MLSQFRNLLWRERADEVFLSKELDEPNESTMPVTAAEVAESRVALHVLSGSKEDFAARAAHILWKRCRPCRLLLTYGLQKAERGGW